MICNLDSEINYICQIESISEDVIITKIEEKLKRETRKKVYIHILQGLPKSEKMELVLQKGTELGASEFTPVNMQRCIVKIDKKDEKKKIERWKKILEAAAKQSKRNSIPKINNIINIGDILRICRDYDLVIIAYEEETKNNIKSVLRNLKIQNEEIKIAVLIGPEGGIDKEEIEKLKQENENIQIVTLGNKILRTETVALAVCSIIMYELEM